MVRHGSIFKKAVDWNMVHTRIQSLPTTKEQGDAFELFCLLFLQESNEYSGVWLQKDIPHTVGKKYKLDGGDYGIDVLVKTKDGRYLGVQCKWRSEEASTLNWSKDKLANTFAHNALDGFIIFSNASKVDAYTEKQIGTRLDTFLYTHLAALNKENFQNYERLLKKQTTKDHTRYTPRADQKETIKQVVKGLQKADRGKLILPCGTGKTLTSLWIRENMKPKKTLVLLPSLSLLRQTKEVWRTQKSRPYNYLCVCSEQDIDKDNSNDEANDTLSEIGFTGLGVFQEAKEIRKTMQQNNTKDLVVFATYQSAQKLKGIPFDLTICDEAHKTAGKKDSPFALVHSNKNIPSAKRLYMTATPRVTKDIKAAKGDADKVKVYSADMNDPKLFGEELYRMSFKEAIANGILCDYKILLIETDEKLQKKVERGSQISEKSLFHIFNQATKKHKVRKAITFHTSIKLAERFEEKLKQEKVNAYHINGKQNTSQRAHILKEFAEHKQKSAITNARCLTEGIDVPTIDMVYFCGKRSSKVDIVQIVGRALRKAKGKRYGYVLVPIVHKKRKQMSKEFAAGEYEGAYKEVIAVLRAMQDHDDRLAEEIHLHYTKERETSRNDIIQAETINIADTIVMREKDIHPYILQKATPSKYQTFEKARAFVHTLKLASAKEWREYTKSGEKIADIPAAPNMVYKDKGWEGIGDWLGTGTIASKNMQFLPFEEARLFVHTLKLTSVKEWITYAKSNEKPADIPANPHGVYKDKGWKGWGDWLGTRTIANFNKEYLSFEEARAFVHTLKLASTKEWITYAKSEEKPDAIPASPRNVYKDKGWKDMGNWLGTGTIASKNMQFLPFEEARAFVHMLNLASQKEWVEYKKSGKKPVDIPATPNQTYKDKGWEGFGDWLGTGTIAPRDRDYLNFNKARAFVHTLKLANTKEWKKYSRSREKPVDIPTNPNQTYKDKGWNGYGDWLGTGTIASKNREYLSFNKARAFVHTLKLTKENEWREYTKSGKKPADIPTSPHAIYKDKGWDGYGDWLGTGTIATFNKAYLSFEEARAFVHTLKLANTKEWITYAKSEKKPADIPATPNQTYKDKGWEGFGDWLGTGTIANFNKEYLPFNKARAFVHALKLANIKEWKKYSRSREKPVDIPTNPNQTYKDKGWEGFGDWLGTGTIANFNKEYLPFKKARTFVHTLKLASIKEWKNYAKSEEKPVDIPATPHVVYKDKGWNGYGDWLGTGTIATQDREYLPFNKARAFVHTLKFAGSKEWQEYVKSRKKPADIPADPHKVYKDKGWEGFGDWLGTGTIATQDREYLPFNKARAFVHTLKLASIKEWKNYAKLKEKPVDIPAAPYWVYRDKGWEGFGDWLGTGTIASFNKEFRSFEEARAFVHTLKLAGVKEWTEYKKSERKPVDIPATPHVVYKDKGWKGYSDWLGNK